MDKQKAILNLAYIRALGEILSVVAGNIIELSPETIAALGGQVMNLAEQASGGKAAHQQQDKSMKNLQIIKALGEVLSIYADNPIDFSLDTLCGIGGQLAALAEQTIEALQQPEEEAA